MTGEWSQVPGPDPLVQALKDELSKIILWNERSAPRSRQVAVGPSELGTECDRRLAYRIAGTSTANLDSDPWPATVGTAIHDWLERAMNRFQQHQGDHGYLTELRVYPDELVKGRCDLYNHKTSMVIDWKAQPDDELVLTPDGWTTLRALAPGDHVIGADGSPTEVLGIFPQGKRPVYKITTSDGSSAEATSDHLWTILSEAGNAGKRVSRVMTTLEVMEELTKPRPRYRFLPELKPVRFATTESALPIDPYTLGLLIGDGSMTGESVHFTNPDGLESFISFEVSKHASSDPSKCPTFGILGAVQSLRDIGLFGHTSVKKFIPQVYLQADVDDRLLLLQGLMDTDGCLQKNRAAFTTSSDQLAHDFIKLVQSLGGKCFDHRDKKLRKLATHHGHLITFKLPPGMCPFRADLPNKKLAWSAGIQTHLRVIRSVELSRTTDVRCIKVAAKDGLYVTRDYLLTHNTAGADVMRKVQKGQIPDGYKTQVQIYGLGHRRAGREVKDVALVFLPRSGWLRDMYVWRAPYDESVAKAALDRMYRIVGQLIEMDIETNPHRFQLIDSAPGDNCVWCPFFLKERDPDIAADDKGCPGR